MTSIIQADVGPYETFSGLSVELYVATEVGTLMGDCDWLEPHNAAAGAMPLTLVLDTFQSWPPPL